MTYHLNWNLLWNRSLALFLPSCELNEIYIQFNRIGECNQVYAFDSIAREIEREKKRIHLHSVFIFQSSMFCSIFTYNNADTHMEFCSHTEQFAVTMPMSTTSWELIMLMRFSHYYKLYIEWIEFDLITFFWHDLLWVAYCVAPKPPKQPNGNHLFKVTSNYFWNFFYRQLKIVTTENCMNAKLYIHFSHVSNQRLLKLET